MSNDSLCCLVYASRRVDPDNRDVEQDIRDIVIASINNNRTVALSGLLVTHADWFLQALEGPHAAVLETYTRIQRDPRHTAATLRTMRQADKRLFARWTMCARMMSDADQTIVTRLIEDRAFDPFTCSEDEALGLLTTVSDIHGRLLTAQHAELLGEVLWSG